MKTPATIVLRTQAKLPEPGITLFMFTLGFV